MRKFAEESLVGVLQKIDKIDFDCGETIFRGQCGKHALLPGIARNDPSADTTALENQMLDQLSLMGASILPLKGSRLELMVLAQHHGMKTRLLDWTTNPLAALWFACSSKNKEEANEDGYLYVLDYENIHESDPYKSDPFSFMSTRAFQPKLNNQRIVAQHGWFTLHCRAAKTERWVTLEDNKNVKNSLTEIRIPRANKIGVIESLERVGVSKRTLFPDLDGLCSHLNWKYADSIPALSEL